MRHNNFPYLRWCVLDNMALKIIRKILRHLLDRSTITMYELVSNNVTAHQVLLSF